MYKPQPIDTSDVVIPKAVEARAEELARNVHEVWAQGRVRLGWRYGETLDNAAKTHPSLVPYEALPEREKEFDRQTAMQTVKLLLKLGCRIE